MNTLQILIEARKLIEKPEDWFGNHDFAGGERCALLALADVCHPLHIDHLPAKQFLAADCEGDVVRFNNTHTHAEVLAAFDRAIARASTESESHE